MEICQLTITGETFIALIPSVVSVITVIYLIIKFKKERNDEFNEKLALKADQKDLIDVKYENVKAHEEMKKDILTTENRLAKQQENLKEDYVRGIGMVNDNVKTMGKNVEDKLNLILEIIKK